MTVGNEYQIDSFDGYDDTILVPLKDTQGWELKSKIEKKGDSTRSVSPKVSSSTYPIGRQKWHMVEPNCGYVGEVTTLTLSQCNIETEFTCDSGHCIAIEKRCNGNSECADTSDEEQCNMVHVPDSYQRNNAPPGIDENRGLELYLKVDVMNIDSINTLDMTVTITANVVVKWYDKRLKFFNL